MFLAIFVALRQRRQKGRSVNRRFQVRKWAINTIMSEKQDPENRKETPTPSLPPGVAGTCRKKAAVFPVPSFRGQAAEDPRLSSCVSPRAAETPVPVGHRPASPPGFSTSCFSRKIPTWKHLPVLYNICYRDACHSHVRAQLPGTGTFACYQACYNYS